MTTFFQFTSSLILHCFSDFCFSSSSYCFSPSNPLLFTDLFLLLLFFFCCLLFFFSYCYYLPLLILTISCSKYLLLLLLSTYYLSFLTVSSVVIWSWCAFSKSKPKFTLREKCPNTEFFSGPYFPVFGRNTEICSVNLGIQSEYRKIRIRKNSVFRHFSCSVNKAKKRMNIKKSQKKKRPLTLTIKSIVETTSNDLDNSNNKTMFVNMLSEQPLLFSGCSDSTQFSIHT